MLIRNSPQYSEKLLLRLLPTANSPDRVK